jgi:ABC-type hemin transport system substrate-binding protein
MMHQPTIVDGHEEEEPSMADVLQSLRDAGVQVDQMSAGQRQVLTGLSEAETGIIIKVDKQLRAAAPDVEGQSNCYACQC